MTSPGHLEWASSPDVGDLAFEGFMFCTAGFWLGLAATGWVIRLPRRLARAVRRYRGTR